jgi:hypothetical protein
VRHIRTEAKQLQTAILTEDSIRLESDLLDERRAQREELPMSLAWFRRTRLLGGGPPFIRVGNRVFYRPGDLREWVNRRATQ